MFELNDETRWILGRPNFVCSPYAARLRTLGHKIEARAEDEQAYVLHWMLSMYEQHGEDWRKQAAAYLRDGRPPTLAVEPISHES
jgi:hypothetical protein